MRNVAISEQNRSERMPLGRMKSSTWRILKNIRAAGGISHWPSTYEAAFGADAALPRVAAEWRGANIVSILSCMMTCRARPAAALPRRCDDDHRRRIRHRGHNENAHVSSLAQPNARSLTRHVKQSLQAIKYRRQNNPRCYSLKKHRIYRKRRYRNWQKPRFGCLDIRRREAGYAMVAGTSAHWRQARGGKRPPSFGERAKRRDYSAQPELTVTQI